MAVRRWISVGWLVGAACVAGLGLWLGQYLAVVVAISWGTVEIALQIRSARSIYRFLGGFGHLMSLYGKNDAASHRILDSRIQELVIGGRLSHEQNAWLERLRALVELRSLLFGKNLADRKNALGSLFIYSHQPFWKDTPEMLSVMEQVSMSLVTEASTHVADLYWRLLDIASSDWGELTIQARGLYQEMFNKPFVKAQAQEVIGKLTDQMQRDGGLPFVILNTVKMDRTVTAQSMMRRLVENGETMDDEIRTTLYWCAELVRFQSPEESGFDDALKTLYHVCLIAPDQAEWLEIDSPYFPQLETLNEMAREGFLFKESLVDSLLSLWAGYDQFSGIFQALLIKLLGVNNKIYDRRDIWARVWEHSRDGLNREYLWLAEGNIAYAQGNWSLAQECFETALGLSPKLSQAMLNRLFTAARLKDSRRHRAVVEALTQDDPKTLYSIADSFLLLGDEAGAEPYYEALKRCIGWESKVDYYRSSFCLDHGLVPLAVKFGERSLLSEPHNMAARFHLSQCYSSAGDVEGALSALAEISSPPEWMHFYRFTLQRDTGRLGEAKETLLRVPKGALSEQDLEAAVEFARSQKDLSLLRHLKRQS